MSLFCTCEKPQKVAVLLISEKGYDRPFLNDTRKLYKIGVNFSSQTRLIEEWKVERVQH